MFLAWKKAQVLDASILALVASLVALAPPTPQMASSTARTPMYTPTHLLRSSLSLVRRSMTSSMDIGHRLLAWSRSELAGRQHGPGSRLRCDDASENRIGPTTVTRPPRHLFGPFVPKRSA